MHKPNPTELANLEGAREARLREHNQERRSFWIGAAIFFFVLMLDFATSSQGGAELVIVRVIAGLSFGIAVAYLPGILPLNSAINTTKGIAWMRGAGAVAAFLMISLFSPLALKKFADAILGLNDRFGKF